MNENHNSAQSGILEPIPSQARFLEYRILPTADPKSVLEKVTDISKDQDHIIGLGCEILKAMGTTLPGHAAFTERKRGRILIPTTQADIWVWVRGEDRGQVVHDTRRINATLTPYVASQSVVDAFRYDIGRDLTGYEDGTENPAGTEAPKVALVRGRGKGLDSSSFVAVQQWKHDLNYFDQISQSERDMIMGRQLSDNAEISDAPPSAHVKRTAQESFDPEAFMLRRSMPWADASGEGLYFSAFGSSFEPFEVQLARMIGEEDGVVDALFRFTKPTTGGYYWCPPRWKGRLDLSALNMRKYI